MRGRHDLTPGALPYVIGSFPPPCGQAGFADRRISGDLNHHRIWIPACNFGNDRAGDIDGNDAPPTQFRVDVASHAILVAVGFPHQGKGAFASKFVKRLLIQ